MKERRHSERVRCRFACEIVRGRNAVPGTVVDVSSGGLAVRAEEEIQQGDPIEIRITVPGRGEIKVEALAWHVRRARHRDSGRSVYLVGSMLSKAPDTFFTLVRGRSATPLEQATPTSAETLKSVTESAPETTPRPTAESTAATSPATIGSDAENQSDRTPSKACGPGKADSGSAGSDAVPAVADLTPYRLRLKHRSSPRTRVITVDATSLEEARGITQQQLGGEWEILEAPGLMRA